MPSSRPPGLRTRQGRRDRAALLPAARESELREYELVVILSPELAEEEMPAAIERLSQSVAGRGGEVVEVNPWGRRKLAYPIRRHLEGNYVLTKIKLEPSRTVELEAGLHMSEEVLRHLLVRLGD